MPYIAIIHIAGDHTPDGIMSPELNWPEGAQLVAVHEYPARKELKCDGKCRSDKGPRAHSIRSPRGFMFCSACGFRHKKTRFFVARMLFDLLGANLYPGAPAAFRTPEGYDDSTR